MRILVVDTHVDQLYAFALELRGIYPEAQVVPFYNPMLAVQYGVNHKIDVVFTKIKMRGVDGFTLARLIGRHNQRLETHFIKEGGAPPRREGARAGGDRACMIG